MNRNQTILRAALIAGACLSIVAPLRAHHAFAAEFDAKKEFHLNGTVTRVEWINPHAWIHIAVKGPDGKVNEWQIEMGTPNTLFRRGVTRDSLKVGTEILVDGYEAKDGTFTGSGRDVTLPDGRKLFLGSSGTGAPYDEKGK